MADIVMATPDGLETTSKTQHEISAGLPAYIVMAHIVMAHIVVAYVVAAHIVTANIVMASRTRYTPRWSFGLQPAQHAPG